MNQNLIRPFSWVIAIAIPCFLLMTAIRLLFTPLYPQVVYRLPGFPEDSYGFSLEDRLYWSRISMDYLLDNSPVEYLAGQQLPDGQPLYNEREVSHMLDVKNLVRAMVNAWWILLVALVGLGIWAWRARWAPDFLHALGNGGRLTIALVVFILAGVAIGFNALFTAFHRIFFSGDSWLFLYSDSLIRLFPLPFWSAAFVFMGVLTIFGAVFLIFLDRKYNTIR